MTVSHPHALFRTGTRRYTARPASNCKTARKAWDFFAKEGPIEWLSLLDGYWGCQRPNGAPIEESDLGVTVKKQ